MAIHVLNKRTYDPGTHPVFIDPTRIFYVGRPSVLGNPYFHAAAVPCWEAGGQMFKTTRVATREEAVRRFREYLKEQERISVEGGNSAFCLGWEEVLDIAHLIAKDPGQEWGLMCWCAPEACHADVIKRAVEYLLKDQGRPAPMPIIREFQGEYRFLSNFWPCTVTIEPIPGTVFVYPSAEHAYVHAKVGYSGQYLGQIVGCETPGQVKRLGKSLPVAPGFQGRKVEEMLKIVRTKFTAPWNPHLARMLVATGDATLIEGNTWHDNFWGRCSCPACEHRREYNDSCGLEEACIDNSLGKILMQVRQEIVDDWKKNGEPQARPDHDPLDRDQDR